MLKRWLVVGGMVAIIGGVAWYALPATPARIKSAQVREGSVAPGFSLKDLKGVARSLPNGKVVLLNFWATWCPPCRREMPSMVTLHRKLKDHGLKVVAVSVDQNINDLTAFVREYSIPFEVLHDVNTRVSHRYGVFRYPESFLIDRSGKVRYHLIGAVNWTNPKVYQVIQTMLIEKTQG